MIKNPPAYKGDLRDTGSIPGSERFPGERNGQEPTPAKFHGQKSLVGYSP